MSRVMMNMEANGPHYPEWNAYLKERRPKTLILWGRNDPFLVPAAAESVKLDVPTAEVRYFDGGHFALDENADAFAEAINETFRSEEHTSELQSRPHLVCRLLLEKKKKNKLIDDSDTNHA